MLYSYKAATDGLAECLVKIAGAVLITAKEQIGLL